MPLNKNVFELNSAINSSKWVEENKASFLPPICNKLMYGAGQLKIMYVGGPNSRKDYHIEEGEEFFFMVKGDMCLKVMENGKPRDIYIKEGEVFLLPCRIPHSPQRLSDTLGLVIERERQEGEQDCLRYYCDDGVTILFEKWFHCTNLGKDLVPIVQEYFASVQYRTGKPVPGSITTDPPFDVDMTTKMRDPFPLKKWIEENFEEIKVNGSKTLFESQQTKIKVYGPGENASDGNSETWLWQIDGKANLDCSGVKHTLTKSDVILIPSETKYSCKRESDSFTISVTMDPQVKIK